MEQRNNEQNSVIFSIAEILNKMSNQVNFLIRNNKLMSQLDIDILMENTRKLYDTICSVRCNMDADSIPMEIEGYDSDFDNDNDSDSLRPCDPASLSPAMDTDSDFDSDSDTLRPCDPASLSPEMDNDSDFDSDSLRPCDPASLSPEMDNEPLEDEVEDSGIRAYRRVKDEHQTLGDILELVGDHSLAAHLQKKPVGDLMAAIGINDKFLLLNELFNGSMEKYNKSIRALNNFSTLLGAKTYMSELQIELQWDCKSDAYKKLNDLIERRFI